MKMMGAAALAAVMGMYAAKADTIDANVTGSFYTITTIFDGAVTTSSLDPPEFLSGLGRLVDTQVSLALTGTFTGYTLVPTAGTGFVSSTNTMISLDLTNYNGSPWSPVFGLSVQPCSTPCQGQSPTVTLSQNFNVSGDAGVASGGPMPVTITTQQTVGIGRSVGDLVVSGSADVTYAYTPKTQQQYELDQYQKIGGDDQLKAQIGYANVVTLRQFDANSSSQNTALRDAEYFFRGYAGGEEVGTNSNGLSEDDSNNFANSFGPTAAVVYMALKSAGIQVGGGPLPAAPVGGLFDNYRGFLAGEQGILLIDAINNPSAFFPDDSPTQLAGLLLNLDEGGSVTLFDVIAAAYLQYFDPASSGIHSFGFMGDTVSGYCCQVLMGPERTI